MTAKSAPRHSALPSQGIEEVGVAATACRASALGVIDFRFADVRESEKAFVQLGELTSRPFGIGDWARDNLGAPTVSSPSSLAPVVCIRVWSAAGDELARAAGIDRQAGRLAIADVATRAEAQRGQSAGFDALILSGHEAGGWCARESSFVLLRGVLAETDLAVWVRGGIGPNVAAGCIAAGATGVGLDGALLLSRDSPVSAEWRLRIWRCDSGETVVVAPENDVGNRCFAVPGSAALACLTPGKETLDHPRGLFFETSPSSIGAPLAFTLADQAAQSPASFRELALALSEVPQESEHFDAALFTEAIATKARRQIPLN